MTKIVTTINWGERETYQTDQWEGSKFLLGETNLGSSHKSAIQLQKVVHIIMIAEDYVVYRTGVLISLI